MPCATGKSLAAFWIAQALGAKTVLVAVPSLALIRQTVTDWTREFLARNQIPDWLCVCSDESVGNLERDDFVGEVYDTGLPTHTDPKEIARRLRQPYKGSKIVFTTYQSSDRLAAAARRANIRFDLAILDEAHKTVGVRSKTFAALLPERTFKARRRLFMTATERVFQGDNDEVLSMDNEVDYGKRFFQLSYKEAIAQRIISDYKILTVAVSDERVATAIEENRIMNLDPRHLDEVEARAVATGVALKRVFKVQGVTHAISFHSSILAAERFRDQQDVLNRLPPRTTNLHISSKKTAGERADLLREFVGESRALMTNARCLTEGVDVPAIDCVVFADPKQSRIDIVQAAGRALRRYPGKDYGYILLPLVVPREMDFQEFAETTGFRRVARIVTGLSIQDERIADEFRAIQQGRIPTGKIVEISGDVPIGMRMSLSRFAEAVSTRIWQNVARVNWRPFEEARAYARGLKLKSMRDWIEFARTAKRPADIPRDPATIYAKDGWLNFPDWLGTKKHAGRPRTGWKSFEEARAFVRGLGLENARAWDAWKDSGAKPIDIPVNPPQVYSGDWIDWRDWLGTTSPQWRPFAEARDYVRSLNLENVAAWYPFAKSAAKPDDIPASPRGVYAKEWTNWHDWLGSTTAPKNSAWRPFEEARAFVRGLGLKGQNEWVRYAASGERPRDIPSNPYLEYANWAGIGDWLGYDARTVVSPSARLPFTKVRKLARAAGIKTAREYKEWPKPDRVPGSPDCYAEWTGWRDFLGTQDRPHRGPDLRPRRRH